MSQNLTGFIPFLAHVRGRVWCTTMTACCSTYNG